MTLVRLLRGGRAQDSPGDADPGAGLEPDQASGTGPGDGRSGDGHSGAEGLADESSADPADGVRARRTRRAALAALTAVLALGGCGFLYGAHRLTSAESARNRALTDTEATHRVAGEVANALARVFSYTPDGTAAAERSARSVLDGRAARQYQDLFDQVRDDLTEQRVTLSTRAVRTGVIELDGDRARLLVFLDQTSRRGKDEATTAAAQLTVTARLENDRWRIVDLKAR
ncbi:nuclear transport factor 2 family protein [Streptomyces sp. NPDC012403]|uniref:nuclear transport factor 2 family protein n=1 Tax=unclassified Streptomyces TaxID=2593676 RepID=UPI001C214D16|nr:nuclear transport factor 2 family protein [Streptomyces sp. AC558_RSS880]